MIKEKDKHGTNTIKLCVSGSAEMGFLPEADYEKAKELGREIARHGATIVTGATTGFPLWAAMGAKEAEGISVGFSPAYSEREHLQGYKLPVDYMDIIVYTGFGYTGRDLLLTRSADAVLIGPGRIGTIHEFTVAYEDDKPIGILMGDWDTDEVIKNIMDKSHKINKKVIFDEDPKMLVEKVIALVKKDKVDRHKLYI
jgi:uncharacterized protein (TIGR00725 family)